MDKTLPLPPGWKKVQSQKGIYYWDKQSNKTQWKFPKEEALAFVRLKQKNEYINISSDDNGIKEQGHDPVSDNTKHTPLPHRTDTGKRTRTKSPVQKHQDVEHSRNHSPSIQIIQNVERSRSKSPVFDLDKSGNIEPDKSRHNGLPDEEKEEEEEEEEVEPEVKQEVMEGKLDNGDNDFSLPPITPKAYITRTTLNSSCSSDSPPPIPERRYDETDITSTGIDGHHVNTSGLPFSLSSNESTPPPIPERTELSKQLLSPSSRTEFTFAGKEAKLPTKKKLETGRYIVSEGQRHFVLFDESMAYAEMQIQYDKVEEKNETVVIRDEQNGISNSESQLYDEINVKIGPDTHISTKLQPTLNNDFKTDSCIYDEIPSLDDKPERLTNANSPSTLHRGKSPPFTHSPVESPSPRDISRDHFPPSQDHSAFPPPNTNPPPVPQTLLPQDRTSTTPVQAYEVVPLNILPDLHLSDDDGLMRVNHKQQRDRGKLFERQALSLKYTRSSQTPPLPPRHKVSYQSTRSPDITSMRRNKLRAANSLDGDSNGYDRLNHINKLNVTLPRHVDTNEYSKLVLSEDAVLMRAGVTIKGSLMNSSTSDVTNEGTDQGSSQDGSLISQEEEEKIPMVHAPNAPSPDLQRQPHLYEDLSLKQETPSLVWDNSDINVEDSSFSGGEDKQVKQKKNVPPGVIPKPETVSDEDYERRLERLDHHFYPELDIPLWPEQPPLLSPRRPSEIKRVARDSWLMERKTDDDLPEGWKKEINEQGQEFYWHIPTGNIQYTKPVGGVTLRKSKSQSPSDAENLLSPGGTKPSTFAAEYWGSLEVSQERLVKGKSVQVVLACMKELFGETPSEEMKLSGGLNRGSRLHLQIYDLDLRWLDVDSNKILVCQPINRIRVWGIRQESKREFGYISRTSTSERHVCHVFRCDIAAMGLVQAMLDSHDSHTKSTIGESKRYTATFDDLSVSDFVNNESTGGTVLVKVPLSSVQRERSISTLSCTSKEQYKRLEATYIGCIDVMGPHGISVVNDAVTELSADKSRWLSVFVDIATSHVKILDSKSESLLKEHRVRFLSFLGISTDDRFCGYIVDSGDNQFQFHGFKCNPNADKLCLALHSACQARYQRVIDAHLTDGDEGNVDSSTMPTRKKSLLRRIGSWKVKNKETEEDSSNEKSQSFIVQFLGFEQVKKPKGVDVITEPLQRLSNRSSGIHLVELMISNTGFTINDPMKKQFSSKHVPTKKITYCLKIRSHFVFIAKEGSKHICYLFSESEVDTATISDAVQRLMS